MVFHWRADDGPILLVFGSTHLLKKLDPLWKMWKVKVNNVYLSKFHVKIRHGDFLWLCDEDVLIYKAGIFLLDDLQTLLL